jgi:hypothetical protein
MKRITPEERYRHNLRKQENTLKEFAANEMLWAEYLLQWYKIRKEEIPDDQYRACLYFLNKEYLDKPGSLTRLYLLHNRLMLELPKPTKELAFDLLAFRFRKYCAVLTEGGF